MNAPSPPRYTEKGEAKRANFTAYDLFFKQKKQWSASLCVSHGLCAEFLDHKYEHKSPLKTKTKKERKKNNSYVTRIPLASTDSQYRKSFI